MHITRKLNLKDINVQHNFFKNFFFPSVVREWNKLGLMTLDSTTLTSFKKQILNFIRFRHGNTSKIHKPLGIKLLIHLRVGLNHLKENKFKHNF